MLRSPRDAALRASRQHRSQLLPTGTQTPSTLQHSAPALILMSFNVTYIHFRAQAGELGTAEGWTAAEHVTQR